MNKHLWSDHKSFLHKAHMGDLIEISLTEFKPIIIFVLAHCVSTRIGISSMVAITKVINIRLINKSIELMGNNNLCEEISKHNLKTSMAECDGKLFFSMFIDI
ncbi:CLUMA_CG001456, isoform A [Clunio marinus]|uniref:CLUMA_CG001456, isoform A n=1 Tax=Clunio marinus TaxID=568069 RepID=A0A1J1HI02_9DIPT|nr:CLUMA_CG001456, isoform A [Clunio marinus]